MEQLRKYRFFNLTLIDLIPTLITGLIIHSYIWFYPLELNIEEQSNRTFIQYIASLISHSYQLNDKATRRI